MNNFSNYILAIVINFIILLGFSFNSFAKNFVENIQDKKLQSVTVIGTADKKNSISGSATIIDKVRLEKNKYSDVNRILREVSGVIVQEEDGFGLRPNIAIRGGRSNRSADITLMEDGILIAPAPYSAPEAYYFPQMERVNSLEVIKGAGAVKYGPRTTNGILNLVSKPIPNGNQADILLEGGSFDSYRTGLTTGTTAGNYGVMLNAFHKESSGFKNIDFIGGDNGFDIEDVVTKFRVSTDASADIYQDLELKLGYYNELSNETYLGLTRQDFTLNPFRRYASSQMDNMNSHAKQIALTHFVELNPHLDVTTSIYRNEFDRSWYRLDGLTIGGTRRSITQVLDNPTGFAAYYNAITGANSAGVNFHQRNNARSYISEGVQSNLKYNYDFLNIHNALDFGVRLHRDEEDRFQREDNFVMQNGSPSITSYGAAGGAGNRIQSGRAFSSYVENKFSFINLDVTPGVRYERIDLKRQDYGNSDPLRTGTALNVFTNTLDVIIPGIGATYHLNDNYKFFAGVHKGFAPPGVPNNAQQAFTDEEESTNYELGGRYISDNLNLELAGFLTDYRNLIGRDTFASGGTGTGDSFNGGEAVVKGIEFTTQYDVSKLLAITDYRLPLTLSYTHTRANFENGFVSNFAEWGTVTKNDELPYTPNNQLYLASGVEADKWSVELSAKYTDEMRAVAGNGIIAPNNLIEDFWTIDATADYEISKKVRAYVNGRNILDEIYVASARPSGVRPGLPLTILTGLKISLY
ncbi:MAG: TonB-dependent receptor [Rickettsiales bacterium]|nr:TonB-dependent receptor [Rickettsiales bacterium]